VTPEGHRLPRALAPLTAGLEALRGGRGTRTGGRRRPGCRSAARAPCRPFARSW
jgi:hypothetical protein